MSIDDDLWELQIAIQDRIPEMTKSFDRIMTHVSELEKANDLLEIEVKAFRQVIRFVIPTPEERQAAKDEFMKFLDEVSDDLKTPPASALEDSGHKPQEEREPDGN